MKLVKNNSDKVRLIDYKNHYVLIKKLHVFSGEQNSKFVCRRCLSSYSSQNVFMKHNHRCNQQKITSNKTSNETHRYWKKNFHRNPLYFRTIYFYQTGIMNGSNYVIFPLRSNAILIIENNDKYCFMWSILASLHPCNNNHPNRVSNCKQYFNELNIQDFDFSYEFKCNDVHRFNEANNLSINLFELNFYQDQNKWRHKLLPIEISKSISGGVIDLAIYKNHYILLKN